MNGNAPFISWLGFRPFLAALAAAAVACGDGSRSREKLPTARPAGDLTTTTYFDSNTAWPPAVINNDGAAGFALGFFGKCANGLNPAVNPSATLSSPATYTTLTTATGSTFTCSDTSYAEVLPSTFGQLDSASKTMGIWINPTRFRASQQVTLSPGYNFPEPLARPWATPDSVLTMSFAATVPKFQWFTNDPAGAVVPYAVLYASLKDQNGKSFWYGATAFDPRGCTEPPPIWVDAPVISSCFGSSTSRTRLAPGSTTTQTSAFSTEKNFSLVIDSANVQTGVSAYNSWAALNGHGDYILDTDYTKYSLAATQLNVETAKDHPYRYDQVVIYAANGNAAAENMALWYQRSDLSGWQFGGVASIGGGGGWGNRTFDLSAVTGFAGSITGLAFNPPPNLNTGWGFGAVDMQTAAGTVTKAWSGANPLPPGPWACPGASCAAYDFASTWSNSSQWGGTSGAGPSYQLTSFPSGIAVDPTPMIGMSVRNYNVTIGPLPCPANQVACSLSCVDLATDVSNCGTCGNSCPNAGQANRFCSQGTCGFACKPGAPTRCDGYCTAGNCF